MITMSDFTIEQLKAIVSLGIENIKEELEERLEIENKKGFPIKVGDCFFDEESRSVYMIESVFYDKIYYKMARVDLRHIFSEYNSFVDRDYHNFDLMIKIEKDMFYLIQDIAKNYEKESNELRLSTINSANNIFNSFKK